MHRPCRFAPKTFHLHSLHACKDLRLSGVSCILVENDDAMSDIEKIQLFESKKIRTAWDEEKQEWFFSIVDVCGVLTDQPDYDHAKNYWKVLKFRLIKEGNESVTKCNQLKLVSPKDGKRYSTDVADMAESARKEVEKRLGRSVVSPEKAIDHIQSPEELPFSKSDEQ